MTAPRQSKAIGVGGRLLVAFLGISAFSLVAAASGFYSLSLTGHSLDTITELRVPAALSWLELSRRVERVVGAAPVVLAVDTDDARAVVSAEIFSQISAIADLLETSQIFEVDRDPSSVSQIKNLLDEISDNLVELDKLVIARL